ncbi:MAG TPA: MFS transporter, partial [Rhodospirillales bacterium]|nr:MFS transporter [Rhodospirillales bacterium]
LSLIAALGWSAALIALAALAVVMVPLATAFAGDGGRSAPAASELGVRDALAEACAHRGFWLLSFGFFVCGFQVVFIALHLPTYLFDRQLPLSVGTTVLALVGLFNVAGTYLAGLWGGRMSKPVLLASIYALRAVAIALFVLLPISTWSAYAFGIVIGLLWLSTVPLTNGTVLTLFGVRNMSMLAGIVFLFHQVGAFFGGWLGGSIYDATGSYDIVWAIAIGLSIVAALLNLPIKEVPVARLKAHVGAT